MKVLTTLSDQVDKLASLLQSDSEPVDLRIIDTADLDASTDDAELLRASNPGAEDRALARPLLGNLKNLALDMPVILLIPLPDAAPMV